MSAGGHQSCYYQDLKFKRPSSLDRAPLSLFESPVLANLFVIIGIKVWSGNREYPARMARTQRATMIFVL